MEGTSQRQTSKFSSCLTTAAVYEVYTDSVLNPLPKLITALGIVCVAIGLSRSFLDGSDFAFRFFSDSLNRFIKENVCLFLATLLMGIGGKRFSKEL